MTGLKIIMPPIGEEKDKRYLTEYLTDKSNEDGYITINGTNYFWKNIINY
jgi:hypothetical protein